MGEKCQRIWEMFMEFTGLDPIELQEELNPIIKKLKVDVNNVQMEDIRQIVILYMQNTFEKKRLKSLVFDDVELNTSNYTN